MLHRHTKHIIRHTLSIMHQALFIIQCHHPLHIMHDMHQVHRYYYLCCRIVIIIITSIRHAAYTDTQIGLDRTGLDSATLNTLTLTSSVMDFSFLQYTHTYIYVCHVHDL